MKYLGILLHASQKDYTDMHMQAKSL